MRLSVAVARAPSPRTRLLSKLITAATTPAACTCRVRRCSESGSSEITKRGKSASTFFFFHKLIYTTPYARLNVHKSSLTKHVFRLLVFIKYNICNMKSVSE